MCKNFRTITKVLCKIQLIQFESLKIESRKNLNSRSKLCFSRNYFNSFVMLNKCKRCHCAIRTLHEIHLILFDELPVPSKFFIYVHMFSVQTCFSYCMRSLLKTCLRCNLTHYFRRFKTVYSKTCLKRPLKRRQ